MLNCPEGEFKCKTSIRGTTGYGGGKCILQRFRCDGDNDCGNWSDEEGCPTKISSCAATEFKCSDGTCIPGQWQCDREQDCDSGEDEKNCESLPDISRTCASDEYTCKDNRCIMVNNILYILIFVNAKPNFLYVLPILKPVMYLFTILFDEILILNQSLYFLYTIKQLTVLNINYIYK